jgi:hypothetical protein
MKRDAALAIIQRHEAELKELGIVSLSLFGSTARNDATHRSDIDVAVRLEEISSGFATIGRLDRIKQPPRASRCERRYGPSRRAGALKTANKDRYLL